MKFIAMAFVAALATSGCRGSVPRRDAPPEDTKAGLLISGRMILPSGETRDGKAAINFEIEGGKSRVYRLPVVGGESAFFLIKPGAYQIARTRSIFGSYQPELSVSLGGRRYKIPFPAEMLRLPKYAVRAKTVVALGALEIRAKPALPGQAPEIRVRLDDTFATRRKLVQDAIRDLSDPKRSFSGHTDSIYWSRSLQNSLIGILAEEHTEMKAAEDL